MKRESVKRKGEEATGRRRRRKREKDLGILEEKEGKLLKNSNKI